MLVMRSIKRLRIREAQLAQCGHLQESSFIDISSKAFKLYSDAMLNLSHRYHLCVSEHLKIIILT
jgi:hypothetical protein